MTYPVEVNWKLKVILKKSSEKITTASLTANNLSLITNSNRVKQKKSNLVPTLKGGGGRGLELTLIPRQVSKQLKCNFNSVYFVSIYSHIRGK